MSLRNIAETFTAEIERTEEARKLKAHRKRANEERESREHQESLSKAEAELNRYAGLIEEAERFLDKNTLAAHRRILDKFDRRVQTQPEITVEECRGFSELLVEELSKSVQERRDADMRSTAILRWLIAERNLDSELKEVYDKFYEFKLQHLCNPEAERIFLAMCKINQINGRNIDEIENNLIDSLVSTARIELRSQLEGNPYQFLSLQLSA